MIHHCVKEKLFLLMMNKFLMTKMEQKWECLPAFYKPLEWAPCINLIPKPSVSFSKQPFDKCSLHTTDT